VVSSNHLGHSVPLTYLELLRQLHEEVQPAVYLEIGVGRGDSLRLSRTRTIAIDPAPHPHPKSLQGKPDVLLYVGTSDAFFQNYGREGVLGETPLDLAFIDGLHTFPQVVRDLQNIERWGHARTVVAIHDVVPRNVREAATAFQAGAWTGDVWRIVAFLREHRPDLRCWLTDAAPTGALVVTGLDPGHEGMGRLAQRLHEDAPITGSEYDRLVEAFIREIAPQPAEVVLRALCDERRLPAIAPHGRAETTDDRAVILAPSRDSLPRQRPDAWIREDALGDDFLAYMGVSAEYRDPAAKVVRHDELFLDTATRIAIDAGGELIRANLPFVPDRPELETRVQAIRERVAAGDIVESARDGPCALLPAPRHDNYYHFLFDDLGRLGFYDGLEESASLVFPVPSPRAWQRQLYELAGVGATVVEVPSGVIRLRNVWVAPLGLSRIDEFRGRAFDRILALAARVSDTPRSSPRRVYVSRQDSRHRRLRNEREVQAVVAAHGFAVVQPETMPVADQIRLFRGAEIVLGVFGAGLTNAAFMRPGGTLLEIAPSRRVTPPVVHNAIFSSLAGSVGLRYGLISAPSASVDAETHDFTVPLDWLEHLLDGMTEK
jgi:hypothetical protein